MRYYIENKIFEEVNVVRKIFEFLMIFVVVIIFAGCSSSTSDYDSYDDYEEDYYENYYYEEEEDTVDYEWEAISIAKDRCESQIISDKGFNSGADLEYGECEAEDCGSYWRVTLRGNITGTVDVYHADWEIRTFTHVEQVYKK